MVLCLVRMLCFLRVVVVTFLDVVAHGLLIASIEICQKKLVSWLRSFVSSSCCVHILL